MDGLTLAKKLADKPFKKILLTGQGGDALAVSAFNQGLIDYYIHKDDLDLQNKLRETLWQLQQQYFIDMSKKTIDLLRKNTPIFADESVVNFFHDKLNTVGMKEYYLLDLHGSYFLKDNQQEDKHLLLHSDSYIDMIAAHAQGDNAIPRVVQHIQEKTAFPYFGDNAVYWQIK